MTVGDGYGDLGRGYLQRNPTTLNGRPTFTATVTTATAGSVTFYDGTALLGAGSTVGTAHTSTFRPSSSSAFWGGTHNITAIYGGSGSTLASMSPVFVETVTQGTVTIELTAKTNGTTTQNVHVCRGPHSQLNNGTYAPNQGLVNFFDGATNIGSAQPITVTANQGGYALWTCTLTTTLAAGTHTITAQYSDINYSLATSNAQTVNVTGTQTLSWTTTPPASCGLCQQLHGGSLGKLRLDPGLYQLRNMHQLGRYVHDHQEHGNVPCDRQPGWQHQLRSCG